MRIAMIAFALVSTAFAGQAFALQGIDGVRWHTSFAQGTSPAAGYAYCDVEFDGFQGSTFADSSSGDADGSLSVQVTSTFPNGNVRSFKGNWSRGGQSGNYNFNVSYDGNGSPTSLNGYYYNPSVGPVMLHWDGSL